MKLIFVYNSDGTIASLIKDTVHKVASPKTYPCNLCKITYPGVTMQEDWQKFIDSLPDKPIFLHRDEFRKQCPSKANVPLPAVFTENPAGLDVLVSHTEINKAKSVQDLIEIVRHYIKHYEQ